MTGRRPSTGTMLHAYERRFLAPLDEEAAATLVRALQILVVEEQRVTE
ncbi:hypothetical protein [Streptomyces lutosisoli]|uniref:Uncharacterized protein n=1 Tax=Streptomyces lutosisoli TaxID=2665721 RepID=A0ABW2VW53_9ACTN